MSLKTLLAAVGIWIQKIFAKAGDEFENVILPVAIEVTNAGKTIADADKGDFIGNLAGKAGANLEDKARIVLDSLAPKLQLAQQFKNLPTSNDILAAVFKLAGESDPDTKSAFYIEFSGMFAKDMADGQLTLAESYQLAQALYNHQIPADDVTEEAAA